MHLRFANDCVLSLRVPITYRQTLIIGYREHDPGPSDEIDGLPDASKAERRVNLEALSLHVKPQLNQPIQVRSDSREKKFMCLYLNT